jgi:hypothetical protein
MASYLDGILRQYNERKEPIVCVAAAAESVDTASPASAVFDSYTVSPGSIVFLPNQSNPVELGPWQFNGVGAPLTRPASFSGEPGQPCFVSGGDLWKGTYFLLVSGSVAGTKVFHSSPEVARAISVNAGGSLSFDVPVPTDTRLDVRVDLVGSVDGVLTEYTYQGRFVNDSGTVDAVSGFAETVSAGGSLAPAVAVGSGKISVTCDADGTYQTHFRIKVWTIRGAL